MVTKGRCILTPAGGPFDDCSWVFHALVALLQSWLEDRPIYLFDEWAADQDPEFKAVFYLELLPMLKAEGKTVIAITHDDRYFHLADRLIKLESGPIVEHTSPPE